MRKTPSFWQFVSTGMIAAMLVFLTGCAGNANLSASVPAPSTQQPSDHVLRIGYQKGDLLHILKERGNLDSRLKAVGYTVSWNVFPSGPPLLEALSTGNLDVGRTGDAPPVFAQAAGTPLVYIGAGKPKYEGSAVLVKAESNIHALTELKGKKVGLSKGSSAHYLLIKALESVGLHYQDVTVSFLPPADARIAFEKGEIDAWVIWDPYFAAIESTGDVRVLTTGLGLSADRDFFLASDTFAKDHPDIIKLFLEEVQTAGNWANAHRKEVAAFLSPILNIDIPSLEKATHRREYGLVEINEDIIQGQQDIANSFYAHKLVPKQVNVKEVISPIAAEFAKEEGLPQ